MHASHVDLRTENSLIRGVHTRLGKPRSRVNAPVNRCLELRARDSSVWLFRHWGIRHYLLYHTPSRVHELKQIRYIATLWNLISVAHAAYLTKYGSYYGKVKRPALA
jgi:hypothetical protein